MEDIENYICTLYLILSDYEGANRAAFKKDINEVVEILIRYRNIHLVVNR